MDVSGFNLKGRVALITGSGRGIGLAIAQVFSGAGGAVAIQDIDLVVAQAAADRINAEGGQAIAIGGDVGDLSIAPTLIDTTIERLGGLHILVNNASIQSPTHWLAATPEVIQSEFTANLTLPILLAQLAVPIFKRQKWGRIINIGSIQGRRGNPNMLPYSLTKAAIEKFTTAIARELAPEGITVNTLAPGYFNTFRNRDQFQTPQDFIDRVKWVPAQRVGEPRDCAGIALLLAGDAGSYITGQTIGVDGGMSA